MVKTRKQIANEIGISSQTLYRWLKKNNLDFGRKLLTVDDQIKKYERKAKAV